VIVSHASHAEDIREKQIDKNIQKKEALATKLQFAQLEALTTPVPTHQYQNQRYENSRGRGKARGGARGWGTPGGGVEDLAIKRPASAVELWNIGSKTVGRETVIMRTRRDTIKLAAGNTHPVV